MPTYGYQCTACNHTFEVFQKIADEPIRECEKCRGKVRRLLYPVGIVFKGPGFHVTDYRKPEKKDDDGRKDAKPEPKPLEQSAKTAGTE
ncbi:MAG TPA: FmdB family zinc ribbon protein [Armatimonadota bacterium]|nr:FmdB family zinc ribbon protein [Armatimonadota bacterium]